MPAISRRQDLWASAVLPVGRLTACGGGSENGGDGEGGDGAAVEIPAGEGKTAYPLELRTPHGSTTLEKRPERVAVVAGLQDLDVALSLGVFPIITDTIAWPWQIETVGERTIEQYDIWSESGLPFEKILAAKPDVILSCTYEDLAGDYDRLAEIAPVLALEDVGREHIWEADWREIMRRIGEALDLQDTAEDQIKASEAAVKQVADAHPQWKGASLSFVMNRGESAGITVTNTEGSSVEIVATSLGFAPQPHAAQLRETAGEVSPENLQLIDADLVLIAQHGGSGTSEEAKAWLEANRLYQQLGAVQSGRVGFVERDENGELPLAWAFDYPNPLSTPWMLEHFAAVVDPILPG